MTSLRKQEPSLDLSSSSSLPSIADEAMVKEEDLPSSHFLDLRSYPTSSNPHQKPPRTEDDLANQDMELTTFPTTFSSTSLLATPKPRSTGTCIYNTCLRLSLWARRYWFLLTLPWVILLAYLIPQVGKTGGPLHTEYTVKYAAVMIIFFLSGLGLEGSILKAFWVHWKVHLVIQSISFGLLPLLGYASSMLLHLVPWMNVNLANGLTVALSMPTTISSNVIMTAKANGNAAVSLINATLGNVVGIVVSPLLVKLYLGNSVKLPFDKIMVEMTITVLAPLVVGQLFRYLFVYFKFTAFSRLPMSFISSLMLLLMVFATFSNTFSSSTSLAVGPFFLILFFILILLPFAMALCFVLGRWWFRPPETISTVYCGSTKTLSLGIPLLTLMFPNRGETTIPLLLYHAVQLFLGGAAAPWLGRWVRSHSAASLHSNVPL